MGIYVHMWLIRFVVQWKLAQHCKAILRKEKKKSIWPIHDFCKSIPKLEMCSLRESSKIGLLNQIIPPGNMCINLLNISCYKRRNKPNNALKLNSRKMRQSVTLCIHWYFVLPRIWKHLMNKYVNYLTCFCTWIAIWIKNTFGL